MRGERALKILLVVVGLLFVALVFPLLMFLHQDPTLAMMLSVYVALGIFLLLAARNPSANRSLIAFTAWSSFTHAAVMVAQSYRLVSERAHLLGGSAALALIGVAMIALKPAKQAGELSRAVEA
jgi:hypothetical protein